MLIRRIYYRAKPYLPLAVRIALRRWHAARVLRRAGEVWPINPAAGAKPEGWKGWPDGKEFAFVLTHDVEFARGVERVRQLAELEMELGFRSSFNFIPEGGYEVPADLRHWLTENGFEVGVQDLHHDGTLYSSRESFRESARRINRYLAEWNAAGFRSGFMLHNLDWLHDLDVTYDASTFDTDPFEPQPDGVGTIFPFWIPRSPARESARSSPSLEGRRGGYVELPYTLVQDFNLFIILREKTIDLWTRKLQWLAAQGGMALLDTHPDYMAFGGRAPASDEFPVERYRKFLEHVRDTWSGRYWHALPREVAEYYMTSCPPPARPKRGRVCMISYSFYETDNRVRRYAESLVKQGFTVDAFSLRREESQPDREVLEGVNIFRLQARRKDERGALDHLKRQCRFAVSCARLLAREQEIRPYDLVHVHNPPDFMAFAAWPAKRTGARVILDIHDIVPELFGNKFQSAGVSLITRALRWVEKLSMGFVDHIIVSNHLWHEKIVARSAPREKTSVFVNHVDPSLFQPQPRNEREGKFLIAFPGSVSWHQGLDIAIKAFARVEKELPHAEFHIHGVGSAREDLEKLIAELGLEQKVRFLPVVPLHQVAALMANVDLGVVPKRADAFGNEAYSTKIMEFMSQGTPVIASRTRIDSYYFDETVLCFFEPENVEELAAAILRLARDREYREFLSTNARAYAARHGWDKKEHEYLAIVDNLLGTSPQPSSSEIPPSAPSSKVPEELVGRA